MRTVGVIALGVLFGCGGGGDASADAAADASSLDADPGSADAAPPRAAGLSFVFVHNGSTPVARFSAETEGPGACVIEPVAGCILEVCDHSPSDGASPNAGMITVESPTGASRAMPNQDGAYVQWNSSVSWTGGDQIRITAEGSEVPAFNQTLVGPPDLDSLDEPSLEGGLVVPLDQPLELRWTGGEDATVLASLAYLDDELVQTSLRCAHPGSAGAGVIPAQALGRLDPAAPAPRFVLFTEERQTLELDRFEVRLGARGVMTQVEVEFK